MQWLSHWGRSFQRYRDKEQNHESGPVELIEGHARIFDCGRFNEQLKEMNGSLCPGVLRVITTYWAHCLIDHWSFDGGMWMGAGWRDRSSVGSFKVGMLLLLGGFLVIPLCQVVCPIWLGMGYHCQTVCPILLSFLGGMLHWVGMSLLGRILIWQKCSMVYWVRMTLFRGMLVLAGRLLLVAKYSMKFSMIDEF